MTEENQGRFSADAIILAARLAEEPWLSEEVIARFDDDLRRIRTRFPQVRDVHPLPDFIPTELLLGLDQDAPWLEAWKNGALTTGDGAIDSLLQAVHATGVADTGGSPDATRWLEERRHERAFSLTFAQPLNTRRLSERLQAASTYFHYVQPNRIVGDGDRITFEQEGDQKRYTLSKGWDDCPAGCISRHAWEFTLLPGGDIHLREYGDPLP